MSVRSYVDVIRQNSASNPNRIALELEKASLSYSDLMAVIDTASQNLSLLGVTQNSRVILDNLIQINEFLLFLALSNLGATTIFTGTLSEPDLATTTVDLFVTSNSALRDHPAVTSAQNLLSPPLHKVDYHTGFASRDDIAIIVRSSGSTGRPKHYAFGAGMLEDWIVEKVDGFGFDKPRVMVTIPTRTGFGLQSNLATLYQGKTMIKMPPKWVIPTVMRGKVDHLVAPPPVFQAILRAIDARPDHSLNLDRCVVGGSKLSSTLGEQILNRISKKVLMSYGSTETGTVTIGPLAGVLDNPNYVGKLLPGIELKTLNDQGEEQPATTPGQLVFEYKLPRRGSQPLGPSLDAFEIADPSTLTRIKSDDLGYQDEDGAMYVEGRLSDVANVGGTKLALDRLNELAANRMNVPIQVQAINVQQESGFDYIYFFVVGSEARLGPAMRSMKFSGISVLSYEFFFIDEMPLNAGGKIDMMELRAKAERLHAQKDEGAGAGEGKEPQG